MPHMENIEMSKQERKTIKRKRSTDIPESDSGNQKQQVTISKFFANFQAESKSAVTTTGNQNQDPIIIDDDTTVGSKEAIKEKKVSSSFTGTKIQRTIKDTDAEHGGKLLSRRTANDDLTASTSPPIATPTVISQATKDKLDKYAISEEPPIQKSANFDYSILKREKASRLFDIEDCTNDTLETNESQSYMSENTIGPVPSTSTASFSSYVPKRSSTILQKFHDSGNNNNKKCSNLPQQSTPIKYTQLEQQVIEIKEQYPGAVLLVECGYKYRLFGEDAEIAARVLKIYCHLDHSFMTASIPVHRLFVHVRRLVSAGYKVGVVKQTETAALKAAGTNKNTPFTRQLAALYTQSTLIGEDVDSVTAVDGCDVAMVTSAYMMCICDTVKDKNVQGQLIGVMAVQPSTCDVIYDCFEDGPTRVELETRLAHIRPVEVLLPGNCTHATEKLVQGLQTVSNHGDDRMRLEKMDSLPFDYGTAFKRVSDFYGTDSTGAGSNQLQDVVNLPKRVICCLAGLLHYLGDFNLTNVLRDTSTFTQFSTKDKYMQLDGSTVRNLELFHNGTDGRTNGSLFWALNQTLTRGGARMLQTWLAKPLLLADEIQARQAAIADIIADRLPGVRKVKATLSRLPDLEKGLASIYYKKCSPLEFYSVCTSLEAIFDEFKIQKEALTGHVTSALLREIITEVPELLADIRNYSEALHEQAAKDNDKTRLFAKEDQFPGIVQRKSEISCVLRELHDHRRGVRITVRQPSLEYTTVLGTEFLVEVKNSNLFLIPESWLKISSTKAVSRFHTPYIVQKYRELSQLRELLTADCHQAWLAFLDLYGSKYQIYRKALHFVSTLDCLLSLSTVAQHHGYCRPEIVGDDTCIEIEAGRHPVIQQLLAGQEQYVPNATHLSVDGQRVMIITGPNMGGKSSYMKQVALLQIMAQMGSYIPAESARLGLCDAVYTRMGAADEIFKGRSTFMVELQDASDIIAKATSRSLVILDELGRGTSTHDGVAIAYATLDFFINQARCLTLFVTHYPLLAEFESRYPRAVGNFHMSFLLNAEASDHDGPVPNCITFLYQLVAGSAARSYGLNVANMACIPPYIVTRALNKSQCMEQRLIHRRTTLDLFKTLYTCETSSVADRVLDVIEKMKSSATSQMETD